jgi:hypothetical protein
MPNHLALSSGGKRVSESFNGDLRLIANGM